jgi:hypothetical protein
MKKTNKRVMSLILCIVMLSVFYVPAYAGNEDLADDGHIHADCCGADAAPAPMAAFAPIPVEVLIIAQSNNPISCWNCGAFNSWIVHEGFQYRNGSHQFGGQNPPLRCNTVSTYYVRHYVCFSCGKGSTNEQYFGTTHSQPTCPGNG